MYPLDLYYFWKQLTYLKTDRLLEYWFNILTNDRAHFICDIFRTNEHYFCVRINQNSYPKPEIKNGVDWIWSTFWMQHKYNVATCVMK